MGSWLNKRKEERQRRAEAKYRLERRERALAEHADSPLREFVYLDEISVYSLLASRLGAIASEFTQSETESLKGELTGSIKGGVPGVASSELKSAIETKGTVGSQVVRKSIVQTTFRELVDIEKEALVIRPTSKDESAPELTSAEIPRLADNRSQPWVLAVGALGRGDLLEIEVELEAEGIFRMREIMAAFFEILEENPTIIDAQTLGGLLEGVMASRMLDRMLVGLVPVRGRAISYRHVTLGAQEFVIHVDALDALSQDDRNSLEVRPLVVVGVAEADLFWRDVRRVLFSRSRYTMMCRMSRGGVHDSWTPVKLVEVLKEVAPDLGDQIQSAGETLERRDQLAEAGSDEQTKQEAMKRALILYATDLAEKHDGNLTSQQAIRLESLANAEASLYGTLEGRRSAFKSITKLLESQFNLKVDPMEAAQFRMSSLIDSGLGLDGDLLPFTATSAHAATHPLSEVRFLDTEIVAIYW